MDEEATTKPKRKRRVKNPETFRERAEKAKQINQTRKSAKIKTFRPLRKINTFLSTRAKKVSQYPIVKGFLAPPKLISRFVVPKYVRNSFKELKLVTWPSLGQSRRLTLAVVVFAVIFGASVAALDYGLDQLFKNILLK